MHCVSFRRIHDASLYIIWKLTSKNKFLTCILVKAVKLQGSKFVKIHRSKLLLLSLRAGSKTILVVANFFCLSVTLHKVIYG